MIVDCWLSESYDVDGCDKGIVDGSKVVTKEMVGVKGNFDRFGKKQLKQFWLLIVNCWLSES